MTKILLLAGNVDVTKKVKALPGHQVVVVGLDGIGHVAGLGGTENLLALDRTQMPEIVILGDQIPEGEALSIAQSLDTKFPGIELMLIAKANTELAIRAMRVGIREIMEPAIGEDELKVLFHRAGESVSSRLKPHVGGAAPRVVEKSRIVVIASPKGGVGKSTIAVNLAVALAAQAPMETVLVDLDVQFGDAATLLDLKPTHSIADAIDTAASADTLILKTFLTLHPSGLYVLCGADSPTVGDKVTSADIKRLLHQLASQFRNVIVDTSAGLREATLAALEEANLVILVSSMEVSSIRALRREIDVLTELKLLPESRQVVLNFSDRRSGLAVKDVETVLGMPVDVVLPRSAAVPIAGNRGEPFILKKRGGPMAKSMQSLVKLLESEASKEAWVYGRNRRSTDRP